jgi:aspartyl-tRNA synthetase
MPTPKIIDAASEPGADVFELGRFGKTAFPAQSPRFYKRMAIAGGMETVFRSVLAP